MAWWKRKGAAQAKPSAAPDKGGMDIKKQDKEAALELCCEHGVPATLLCPETGQAHQARFAATGRATLEMELTTTEEPCPPKPLSVCCVSFFRSGRAYVFITSVLDAKPSGRERFPRVVLRQPEQLAGTDVRASSRVPVKERGLLDVDLETEDGHVYEAHAVDISFGGMAVDLVDVGARLREEDRVKVRLRREDEEELTYAAVVRTRSGAKRLGLFFADFYIKDEFRPPTEFRTVVLAMERALLRSRH